MFKIKVRKEFDAAHFLIGTNTTCDQLHGHRWTVWVTLCSEELSSEGWVLNFTTLKKWVSSILEEYDHDLLNYYLNQPTAENLAYVIYRHVHIKLVEYNHNNQRDVQIGLIEIAETPGNISSFQAYDLNVRSESLQRGLRAFWESLESELTRKKHSENAIKQWLDKDVRERMIERLIEGFSDPKLRRDRSKRMKKCNPMHNRRIVEKMLVSLRKSQKLSPNKEEQKVIKFMKEHDLPFEFVGDGSLIIDGKIPDFVNKEKKIVIEYNSRFWHSDNNPWYDVKDDSKEREEFFTSRGYKFMIIWDDEFLKSSKKIVERIRKMLGE